MGLERPGTLAQPRTLEQNWHTSAMAWTLLLLGVLLTVQVLSPGSQPHQLQVLGTSQTLCLSPSGATWGEDTPDPAAG